MITLSSTCYAIDVVASVSQAEYSTLPGIGQSGSRIARDSPDRVSRASTDGNRDCNQSVNPNRSNCSGGESFSRIKLTMWRIIISSTAGSLIGCSCPGSLVRWLPR